MIVDLSTIDFHFIYPTYATVHSNANFRLFQVVGFPTPVLRWEKDGEELRPGDIYQLTGTNSLGTYCCIAKNCMGETSSTALLTLEDIQNQLSDEERLMLTKLNQPPKFLQGLKSQEAKINEEFKFSVLGNCISKPINQQTLANSQYYV